MNWTLILGFVLIVIVFFDIMHLCYRWGREDKQNQEQERLRAEIGNLRYQVKELSELKNNIANNFPELDLKSLTLEELLSATSTRDYKRIYDEAYHDAYYDAFNNISKEREKIESIDKDVLLNRLKEHTENLKKNLR